MGLTIRSIMIEAAPRPESDEDFNQWEGEMEGRQLVDPFGVEYAVQYEASDLDLLCSDNHFTSTGGSMKSGDVDDPKSD